MLHRVIGGLLTHTTLRVWIANGLIVIACFAVAFALMVNFDTLYYGFADVPPYYGRTTNMDKWSNPLRPLQFST